MNYVFKAGLDKNNMLFYDASFLGVASSVM
jgi:hypothetical protein